MLNVLDMPSKFHAVAVCVIINKQFMQMYKIYLKNALWFYEYNFIILYSGCFTKVYMSH